jgi:hypothetical protein
MTARRQRTFVLLLAHLAVLALFFQVAAIDHWRPHADDVTGVEGKSTHTLHCHGLQSGCADAGGAAVAVTTDDIVPLPPRPVLATASPSEASPIEASISIPHQPPRAS